MFFGVRKRKWLNSKIEKLSFRPDGIFEVMKEEEKKREKKKKKKEEEEEEEEKKKEENIWEVMDWRRKVVKKVDGKRTRERGGLRRLT